MASSFNLSTFLNEYESYNKKAYTVAEAAQEAMEMREINKAEEAIKQAPFGVLTIKEKLRELGLGERVEEQLKQTAAGMFTGIVKPFLQYLEDNEKVFDEALYKYEMNSYGKQLFFSKQALVDDIKSRADAGKFIMNM